MARPPGRGRPWGAGGADHSAAVWLLRIGNRRSVPELAGAGNGDEQGGGMAGKPTTRGGPGQGGMT